jgi:hypothetical protein
MVFNTFSNIFQLHRRVWFYWWRKPEYPEKTTPLSQVTDGRRGHDRMVVGFAITYMESVPFTTKVVSSNPVHGKYSIQHYEIKFVSDLRQGGGFLRVLRFPPPIKPNSTM